MSQEFLANENAFQALRKPKAIIFDWDNTLVDSWPVIQYAIDHTMVKMGRQPWGLQKVKDNIHKSMRESFPQLFGDNWQQAGEIYKEAYRGVHMEKIALLPYASELINMASQKGIIQFVVSNKMGPTLRKEAQKLGVDKKFFSLVGAGDAVADKPSRHPVELALIGSEIDPKKDDVWFIGDTITDIECAYQSNCKPIVYGLKGRSVSQTIPASYMSSDNQQGIIPVYFNHRELISLLEDF